MFSDKKFIEGEEVRLPTTAVAGDISDHVFVEQDTDRRYAVVHRWGYHVNNGPQGFVQGDVIELADDPKRKYAHAEVIHKNPELMPAVERGRQVAKDKNVPLWMRSQYGYHPTATQVWKPEGWQSREG